MDANAENFGMIAIAFSLELDSSMVARCIFQIFQINVDD
jgi:hypothetical protein